MDISAPFFLSCSPTPVTLSNLLLTPLLNWLGSLAVFYVIGELPPALKPGLRSRHLFLSCAGTALSAQL